MPYKITTIFIFSIFVAVVFVSCNEVESTYKYPEPQTQPSIIGTWKLKYFVDVENNTKREPDISKGIEHMDSLGFQYDYEKTMKGKFVLLFRDNLECWDSSQCKLGAEAHNNVCGFSAANLLSGCYFVDYNTKILTTCMLSTLLLNSLIPDSHLYENILRWPNKTFLFKLSEDTLQLYYDNNKKYLEFNKIGDGYD